ncbi:MAG: antibiotic biosynthesis monooxygenase [Eubacterium sp.]|nr:antibiotic biosynthesis monooxygenase [Eubacterium sp.]
MIKIVAKMVIQEDKVDEFLKITQELVEKSSAEEGNISYTLNRHIEKSNEFCFIELWRDKEATAIHEASEHFTRILPMTGALAAEPPQINLYTEVEW